MRLPVTKILDGKLTLYLRPNSRFYWARFNHKRVPYRVSTNTDNIKLAEKEAVKWFYTKQAEISSGIAPAPKQRSFATCAEKALATYKASSRSRKYIEGLAKILKADLLPFMGKMDIADINQTTWTSYKHEITQTQGRRLKKGTMHQHKNGLMAVLNTAYNAGLIKEIPKLKDDKATASDNTPRTYFPPAEYRQLLLGLDAHIAELAGNRWQRDAQELKDYVEFVVGTGLRVGEAMSVRFCDCEVITDIKANDPANSSVYVLIKNIKGKRGTGEAKSDPGTLNVLLRIRDRRLLGEEKLEWQTSTKPLFTMYHREMFKILLRKLGLYNTQHQPPLKRDLVSLRHTFISNKLLSGVDVYDLARQCRTSVQMIEQHYSRWLGVRLLNMTGR